MRGDLRQSSLAEVMRHLYAERKNGVLHLSHGESNRRVYFKKGVAIFADAADEAFPTQDQALTLLYSLFGWTGGEFTFEDLEPDVDEAQAFTLSPSVMVLEGSRRIGDRDVLEHLTGGPRSVFACTETSELPLFTTKLSPQESAILKIARERRRFTRDDLSSMADALTVVNALNALVAVGLVEIVDEGQVPASEEEAASTRSEVEDLLDTFDAQRTGSPAPVAPGARPDTVSSVVLSPPGEPGGKTSWVDLVSGMIPAGKARVVALVAVAFVFLAGTAVLWLSSAGDETAPSSPSTLPTSTPTAETRETQTVGSSPKASELDGEPAEEPSDAELFYSANVAFEKGDFEQSKAELEVLLERRSDFAAAHELMARVERELSPKPRAPEPAPAQTRVVEKSPEPEVKSEPERVAVEPNAPVPADLFDDARDAFTRGDLETTRAKLDELEGLEADYPGMRTLREQLAERRWEQELPIALVVRHDHALGGCEGVLTLTKTGYGYRSKEHEWAWSFSEVAETERRDSDHLRIETKGHSSFNFELRERLSDEDWARHQAFGKR